MSRDTLPLGAAFPIFSARGQTERRAPLATCTGFIAVGWCPNTAAPHTYGGSLARQQASAAGHGITLCGLATYPYPHTGLCNRGAGRSPFASEAQARVRGSHLIERDGSPSGESRSKRPINRRGIRETGPPCSYAFNDAVSKHARASCAGRAQQGPVRPWARALHAAHRGQTCACRRRCRAFTWRTPPGPVYGLRRSTLGLCRVCSPSARGTAAQQD